MDPVISVKSSHRTVKGLRLAAIILAAALCLSGCGFFNSGSAETNEVPSEDISSASVSAEDPMDGGEIIGHSAPDGSVSEKSTGESEFTGIEAYERPGGSTVPDSPGEENETSRPDSSASSVIWSFEPAEVGIAPGSSDEYGDDSETGEAAEEENNQFLIAPSAGDVANLSGTGGSSVVSGIGESVTWRSCLIDNDSIVLKAYAEGFDPEGFSGTDDRSFYYLLEFEPFEDSIYGHRSIASCLKADDVYFSVPLNQGSSGDRLYNKFVVCVWTGEYYEAVSDYICVLNPEAVAKVKTAYREPLSKKGLLIEISEISDAFSLGVCNVIVNITFDSIIGEGIDYVYDGETYHFNKSVIEIYDKTISMFSNKSMNVNAVLLNNYTATEPDLFYTGVTGREKGVMYYNFNASTETGYKYLKAISSFLADRYSGTDPDHGLIQNWIIGNEINNQVWNYYGKAELSEYVKEYVRSFRVMYNAIKSEFASARVYFSLDNNWNQANDDVLTYTARDTLMAVAEEISAHGNIDWGLGYHPYPVPSFEPEFWDDFDTGLVTSDEDSPVVNFANLSVLTDFMQREEMLDSSGEIRHIVLSEQGFTSESATRGTVEELQAAAFAYAYYIVDSNPYIDAFILSRQIDAPSEVKSSLAFGLWTTDSADDSDIKPSSKKYIWNVFKNIDKKATTLKYSEFAKSILGIEKWSDIIPDFKWRKLE